MRWKILKEDPEKYQQRQEALRTIAVIVASHPEWLEEEPELGRLLEVAGAIDILTSPDLDEALKQWDKSPNNKDKKEYNSGDLETLEEYIYVGDVGIPISELKILLEED